MSDVIDLTGWNVKKTPEEQRTLGFILDPSDLSARANSGRPVINFKYRGFDHTRGSLLRVIGTYWLDDTLPPVLALVRADEPLGRRRPCLVLFETAWRWAEETGAEGFATQMAMEFAVELGLDPRSKRDVHAILAMVRDHMDELVHMPVPEGIETTKDAEVVLKFPQYGKTIEREVRRYG